jgi:hypothetical protein
VQDKQKFVLKRTMQRLGDAIFEEDEEESPDEGWCRALGGWKIKTATASLDSPATEWIDLPDYVFEQVLAHVQEDRAGSVVFRQVCWAWREAHDQRVSVLTPKCAPPHDTRSWRHFAAVKTLRLSAHVVNDGVLIALAASIPLISLTSLSLGKFVDRHAGKHAVPSVTNEGIKAISCLTALTSLELNHCERVLGHTGVESLAALTALTWLSLAGCTNIPRMEGLMRELSPLTLLSSLSVQYCYKTVADGEKFALGLHTSLTSLDFGGCSLTDVGVTALVSLTALKSLSLWHCGVYRHLTDLGVAALASLTQLTSLNLGHCYRLTDVGVTPLVSLTGLTSLNLHNCYEMTDEGIMALALVLTNLTSLELAFCHITVVGVTALAGLAALTSLDLGWNTNVTDEEIIVLATVLTRLTHLELSVYNITDAGVTALAGLTGLTHLGLFGDYDSGYSGIHDSDITDAGIITLSKLTALNNLNLSNCRNMTDKGLAALARSLTSLTCLDLTHCSYQLTSEGMMALAHLTALTDLDLQLCHKAVTDEGMRNVAKLSSLTSLRLAFCKNMSDKGVASLTSLTNLTDLDLGGCTNLTDTAIMTALGSLTSLTSLTWPDDPDYTSCDEMSD